jgi:hypothetical protein
MESRERSVRLAMLAVLPLLTETQPFRHAVLLGAGVCAVWWVTFLLFKISKPAFPKALYNLSVVLWMSVLGFLAWTVMRIGPFWILSISILWSGDKSQEASIRWAWPLAFRQGVGLWVILIILATGHELLSFIIPPAFVCYPVVALFLLGFIAAWDQAKIERLSS